MVQLQPGAALAPALSLADLDPALVDVVFNALSSADMIRVLQVCTAFKQALTQPRPRLLCVGGNGQTEVLHLDLTRSFDVGRGYLCAHAYPKERISLLKYVSRVACRVRAVSTAPAEFEVSVPPMSSMNGILVDADGDGFPTQHMLSGRLRLPAGARFALDVQNASISTFEFACLPPHVFPAPILPPDHPMMAATFPYDEMADDEGGPLAIGQLDNDLISLILGHCAASVSPTPHDLLVNLQLSRVCKSWQTLLAPQLDHFETRMSAAIRRLGWAVFPNDPHDRTGVMGVWQAGHSRGKGERMLASAFPILSTSQKIAMLQMPCFDVFRFKKGGTKSAARDDAWAMIGKVIEYVEGHYDDDSEWVAGCGDDAVFWGCGGAADRLFAQCSMAPGADGFINPDNMRPLNGAEKPETYDALGLRKTLDWEAQVLNQKGFCKSINLASSANGRGTYRAELWRDGQLVHTFMIGIFPHPGSQSWGDVEDRAEQHAKFLRDLAFLTPSQTHVIRINADDFD